MFNNCKNISNSNRIKKSVIVFPGSETVSCENLMLSCHMKPQKLYIHPCQPPVFSFKLLVNKWTVYKTYNV